MSNWNLPARLPLAIIGQAGLRPLGRAGRGGLPSRVGFQPGGERGFFDFAVGNSHHHLESCFFIRSQFVTVLRKEKDHDDEGYSLVAVDEGMVGAEVKAVGGSFFKHPAVN